MTKMTIELARKVPGAKIAAYDADGYAYILNHRFAHRDDIKLIETLAKIRAAKVIDLRYWHKARKGEC